MSDTDKEFDEFVHNSVKFFRKASKACKERGKTYDFTCPVCGGKAHAIKVSYNGHLHASCDDCGICRMT